MSLASLKLGTAFNLMMRTLPILLVRLGATLVFWLIALVYFAIVGFVAYLIGQAIEILGLIIFLIGIGGMGFIYHLAYRYVFYMIKAAHIAVIAELLQHGKLPDGKSQLAFGKERVQERFGEANAMFVVDEVVSSVVRAFTGMVYNIASILPGDTVRSIASIVNRIIMFATNFIDEAIMARSFYRERESVWENARDGVVLYAMVWKPILMNAVVLMLLSYIPFILAFVIFAAPVGFIVNLFSGSAAGWTIIALLLFSWLIKVAIGDAFAMTAIIAAYHRETSDLKPDPQMAARLDGVSDRFKDLAKKAQDSFDQKTQPKAKIAPVEFDTEEELTDIP
ncbi:hypothetical protein MASR2M15_00460 [Anaerolineales bacterium]